jgi:hypothetical protein
MQTRVLGYRAVHCKRASQVRVHYIDIIVVKLANGSGSGVYGCYGGSSMNGNERGMWESQGSYEMEHVRGMYAHVWRAAAVAAGSAAADPEKCSNKSGCCHEGKITMDGRGLRPCTQSRDSNSSMRRQSVVWEAEKGVGWGRIYCYCYCLANCRHGIMKALYDPGSSLSHIHIEEGAISGGLA